MEETKVRQYTRTIEPGVDENMDDQVDQLDRWLIGYKDTRTFIEIQGESLFDVIKMFLLVWAKFKRSNKPTKRNWRRQW